MTNREWVVLPFICAMHSNLWLTASEDTYFFALHSHLISSHSTTNSKWAVTPPLLPVSSHLIPWKTESECHCHSFLLGIYLMTSHNPQQVSGTSLLFFTSHYIPWPTDSEWQHHFPLPGSLISSHPMTTASEWCCPLFCNAVPSHQIPWPTACGYHCHFFWYPQPQQRVTLPMMNRMWVTHPFFLLCSLIPWPTAGESHYPLFLLCSLGIP